MQGMRLYGSLPGLILVHVVYGIPITTLIFRNYYATIPGELLEAAAIGPFNSASGTCKSGPCDRMTERSIKFSSSRTLPGQ